MIFFCHLCKRLGAEAEGSVCKHSYFTHAPPPSGGAFGALLCRKEFLLNCSSHSPPNHWAALRPRPRGATVLLSATFHGNSCACCRAGFGSEEQRLLQTPDLVVLLISYLFFKKCSYCWCLFVSSFVCLFSFYENFSSKLTLTYLVKIKLTYWNWETLLFIFFLRRFCWTVFYLHIPERSLWRAWVVCHPFL